MRFAALFLAAMQPTFVMRPTPLRFKPCMRKRPPKWVRQQSGGSPKYPSIWTFQQVPPHHSEFGSSSSPSPSLPVTYEDGSATPVRVVPACEQEGPFKRVYRDTQTAWMASKGTSGPLHPLYGGGRMLVLAYLSGLSPKCFCPLPKAWDRSYAVSWVVWIYQGISQLYSRGRRSRISVHVSRWSSHLSMIPRVDSCTVYPVAVVFDCDRLYS